MAQNNQALNKSAKNPPPFADLGFEGPPQGGIGGVDLEKLLAILNKSLWWIILFIVLSLTGAYLYLRYTKPIYESYSVLKLNVQKSANQLLGLTKSEEGSGGTNLQGELEIIKSTVLFQKVLERIDLGVTYQQSGNFISSELYSITPFKVVYEVKNPAIYGTPIILEFIDDKQYILKFELIGVEYSEVLKFNTAFDHEFFKFKINLTRFYTPECNGRKFIFILNSNETLMDFLRRGTNAYIMNAEANTIRVGFQDNSPEKARDIVNVIDTIYGQQTIAQKNLANEQTLKFLEEQMNQTSERLNMSENEIQEFLKRNKLSNLDGSTESIQTKIEEILRRKS